MAEVAALLLVALLLLADGSATTSDAGRALVWLLHPDDKLPSVAPSGSSLSEPLMLDLEGARGEHLAYQLALQPTVALSNIIVAASALTDHSSGAAISADAFSSVRRVMRVNVTGEGQKDGQWPDPLPLLRAADSFAPATVGGIWVTLRVPSAAAPGNYTARVAISCELLNAGARANIAMINVRVRVYDFSVQQRTLQTDAKLSDTWVRKFASREPDGQNITAVMLRYYREMVAHRTTMMGWGGVSIYPSIGASFSDGFSAVTLDTTGFDAMAAELEALGVDTIHFPLPSVCSCCEPITHIRDPIPQVIPQNATWALTVRKDGSTQEIQVFDSVKSTNQVPVLNSTFVHAVSMLVRTVAAHLDSKGWLGGKHGTLQANYMLWIDEADATDVFTARAMVLINRLLKLVEPRLMLAQTRFPTDQYGKQNRTLVAELESQMDLWVASVDEWETYHYVSDTQRGTVPQRLGELSQRGVRTQLYDNDVPIITEPPTRTRLAAWQLWLTHYVGNNVTQGHGLNGSLSFFMMNGWTADPWSTPSMDGQAAGLWYLFYPPREGVEEAGPIPSIRWEAWRGGLEETEYFFTLQRLLAKHTNGAAQRAVPDNIIAEANAALALVQSVTWGFPYGSNKWQVPERPYTSNVTLVLEVKRRVGRAIDHWVANERRPLPLQ